MSPLSPTRLDTQRRPCVPPSDVPGRSDTSDPVCPVRPTVYLPTVLRGPSTAGRDTLTRLTDTCGCDTCRGSEDNDTPGLGGIRDTTGELSIWVDSRRSSWVVGATTQGDTLIFDVSSSKRTVPCEGDVVHTRDRVMAIDVEDSKT